MPAPGEPYRPLIALPKKVMEIDPAYASVSDAFFTAYYPPRTLVVAAAMAPDITTSQVITAPVTATPGPELSLGASKTVQPKESAHTPVQSQAAPQAVRTTDPESTTLPSHHSEQGLKQNGGDSETSAYLDQQSSTLGDPGLGPLSSESGNSKATTQMLDIDPERASPEQMLPAESAFIPKTQSQPMTAPGTESSSLQTGLTLGSEKWPGGFPYFEKTSSTRSFPVSTTFPETYITDAGEPITINPSGLALEASQVNIHMKSADPPSIDGSPVLTASDAIPDGITPLMDPTSQAVAAATIAIKFDATLAQGGPAVTVDGLGVSLDPAGDLVIGSETMALERTNGNLGSSNVRVLQTGGPSANNALTTPQESSTTVSDNNLSKGQALENRAGIKEGHLPWKMVAVIVISITACFTMKIH